MRIIELVPWRIACDCEATSRIYGSGFIGKADQCDCEHCLNFAAVRDEVYPAGVRNVFEQMGIDFRKESEIFYVHSIPPGRHLYGGEFKFIGTVQYIDESYRPSEEMPGVLKLVEVTENFSWAFSDDKVGPYAKIPGYHHRAYISFNVIVPWVLEAEEPK